MPAADSSARRRISVFDNRTDTREVLANARLDRGRLGLDDYFIVDVDSHREPVNYWHEVVEYIDNPVMRRNSQAELAAATLAENTGRGMLYVSPSSPPGYTFQALHGRVPHQQTQAEAVEGAAVHREVELCRRAMESMGIDVQVVFPTVLLGLGMAQLEEGEAQIAYAYDKWFVERVCPEDDRIKFMPYLPLRDPDMCVRIIEEFGSAKGVAGFLVTSIRHDPVHHNRYMKVYSALEERRLPLAFHAGPTWDDQWMRTMNRFVSVHALSFVHCNMVHLTNWVINGLPERFPNLPVVWIESGLAWVPFMMQRLDSEFMKRPSEAPLLRRRPSEYIREMYFSSQPLEMENMELLEATFHAMNASTQLLYASDWPHWDFDPPRTILDIPFLTDDAQRGILGENARKLFNL